MLGDLSANGCQCLILRVIGNNDGRKRQRRWTTLVIVAFRGSREPGFLEARSWLGRQDWKLSKETAAVFSYCTGTLWIEKITLWKYPLHSPSTPAKLWMCRLTPMLKGGNWIFFQNSSWETKLHFPYTSFQGFESIWGQTCPSSSASFWTAAGIAGRTSSSCMPATRRYTISYVQVYLMLLLGKTGTSTESYLRYQYWCAKCFFVTVSIGNKGQQCGFLMQKGTIFHYVKRQLAESNITRHNTYFSGQN